MSSGTVEKKKVFGLPHNVGIAFLCVLGAFCLYEFYSNVLAGPPGVSDGGRSAASTVAAAPTIPMPGSLPGAEAAPRRPVVPRGRNEEFNPVLRSKRPEDRIDPAKVDPTIRTDLLKKVQAVELAVGTRNLFQMGVPPKPPELPAGPETIVNVRPVGPVAPAPPAPPPAPVDPPVQLKFYGYSTVVRNGKKTGYFMDGEDIAIAGEGEMVKRRYRVLRIMAKTVQIEDTEAKRTIVLPIADEAQS
jgi:hypothetical protein